VEVFSTDNSRFWNNSKGERQRNEGLLMFNLKRYYTITGLMALIASPLAASIGLVGVALIVTPAVTLALVWVLYVKKATLPDNASEMLFPVFLAFCYYMCVWIAVFGLSGYRFESILFKGVFSTLTTPYFILDIFVGRSSFLFPLTNAAITVITALTIIATRAISKKKIVFDKKLVVYIIVFICLSGVAAYQHYDRTTKILDGDHQVERIKDEVDIYGYRPFSKRANEMLKQLGEPATISFTEKYPRLDGATAAYPVYAAIVQELYEGLDETTVEQYVACSKTDEAYLRLIDGKVDVFFGAQPSRQQIDAAQEKEKKLELTPIAREAFVFFVNKDNPIDSLTLEQIQDIYQKKITKWDEVGGKNEKILPFQRPDNSGSQTIMLAKVMGEKALPAPLWEEYAMGMGMVIGQVAEYRNYSSAIGYSFRYYATGMNPNDNIKLLAINGVEPTVENIRNGTYPFTVDVYAVTAGSSNENVEKLMQWILSEQGQNFIEICGYVRTA